MTFLMSAELGNCVVKLQQYYALGAVINMKGCLISNMVFNLQKISVLLLCKDGCILSCSAVYFDKSLPTF